MKNKRVKQMICDFHDNKHEMKRPFGHYFDKDGFKVCFFNGWGPDNYYDDWELVGVGEVSLTCAQLKGQTK